MVNQKVCKKKYLSWVYGVVRKNLLLGVTIQHHEASLLMPVSDLRDRFFYPHSTPMKDTYNLKLLVSQSKFSGTRKFTLRYQYFGMNFDFEISRVDSTIFLYVSSPCLYSFFSA